MSINSENAIPDIIRKCKIANVPVIVQGVDVEDVTSVTVDNYVGMKELCRHLVEDHGCRLVGIMFAVPICRRTRSKNLFRRP